MVQEEFRKGPWTEQEDVQLVFYVNLFGDRRWDFLAKVSGLEGLKRTGKSCRLRWVNYLHPGLKRCKMTPQEERLILELHSKWGNKWSRIARKLPGRTDNEIKNYWRTHMRKKAQEKKKGRGGASISASSSLTNCCSYSSNSPAAVESVVDEANERDFYDTGGVDDEEATQLPAAEYTNHDNKGDGGAKAYTMDDIWKDIELLGDVYCSNQHKSVASPIWNYWPETLWMTAADCNHGGGESKIVSFPPPPPPPLPPTNDQFYSSFDNQDSIFLTG